MRHLPCTMLAAIAMAVPAAAGDLNTTFVGQWDGFAGSYADVWAEGDYAYVGHFGGPGVDIIDISDPANPFRVAAYALPAPNETASAQDVKVADGILYIGLESSGNSVHIVDVRDPTNPVGLVDIALAEYLDVHNVFISDGYLYIVDSAQPSIAIVDMTGFDPDNPPAAPITETKWIVPDVGEVFVHDITVVGDRMYAAAWDSGIWIYDVTNIETEPPVHLGDGPGNNTHSSWPTADGQYIVAGEERQDGGITVYRITEGVGAVTLDVTDTFVLPGGTAHNQTIIGHRVYNSWYGFGLQVLDVDPDTGLLEVVATYDTSAAWGVYPFLGQDRVLVSDISDGLIIVSVDVALPCAEDLDGNGSVGFGDILAVLAAWGNAGGPEDLDSSGFVDFGDLLAVLGAWGNCT